MNIKRDENGRDNKWHTQQSSVSSLLIAFQFSRLWRAAATATTTTAFIHSKTNLPLPIFIHSKTFFLLLSMSFHYHFWMFCRALCLGRISLSVLCAYACIFKFVFKMKSLSDMRKSEVVPEVKVFQEKKSTKWNEHGARKNNNIHSPSCAYPFTMNKKMFTEKKESFFLLFSADDLVLLQCSQMNVLYPTNLFVSFMTHWIRAPKVRSEHIHTHTYIGRQRERKWANGDKCEKDRKAQSYNEKQFYRTEQQQKFRKWPLLLCFVQWMPLRK